MRVYESIGRDENGLGLPVATLSEQRNPEVIYDIQLCDKIDFDDGGVWLSRGRRTRWSSALHEASRRSNGIKVLSKTVVR